MKHLISSVVKAVVLLLATCGSGSYGSEIGTAEPPSPRHPFAPAGQSNLVNLASGTQATPAGSKMNGHARFRATRKIIAHQGNYNQACKDEFGFNWRQADWDDIEAYYNAGGNLADLVNFSGIDGSSGWVTRDGRRNYKSRRHYYVSYHNHNKPSHYLAHENLDNYYHSLGSWYDINLRVFCYLPPQHSIPDPKIVKAPISSQVKVPTSSKKPGKSGFAMTSKMIAYKEDYDLACKHEYGRNWRQADWGDLISYYLNRVFLDDLLTEAEFYTRLSAWVTRDRSPYKSGSHYFATYLNHKKPSNYKSYDDIDNLTISLSSGKDMNLPVLCFHHQNIRPK